MKTPRESTAQGAFEYLMSYGWAILVIVVLGIVLYNLGAFNPSQASVVSGFSFLKPLSVEVDSISPDDARIIARVQNIGGRDLSVSSTTISTPSATCFYFLSQVADSQGNNLTATYPFTLSAGQEVKITYWSNGTNCGKNVNSKYNYKISFSGTDSFGIPQTDAGVVSGAYQQCPGFPTSGLVGYWHFREGSGTVAADDSGNGNNAILAAGAGYGAGKTGYGLNLNGASNSYASIPLTGVNTAAGGYNTVLFWMKWNGVPGKMPFGFNNSYDLWIPSSSCMGFNTGAGNAYGINPTGLSGQWAHLGLVFYNGNTGMNKIYLNGQNQTLTPCSGSPGTQTAVNYGFLGTWGLDRNYMFQGLLDEALVYNRELSASEIQAIYNCGFP